MCGKIKITKMGEILLITEQMGNPIDQVIISCKMFIQSNKKNNLPWSLYPGLANSYKHLSYIIGLDSE